MSSPVHLKTLLSGGFGLRLSYYFPLRSAFPFNGGIFEAAKMHELVAVPIFSAYGSIWAAAIQYQCYDETLPRGIFLG